MYAITMGNKLVTGFFVFLTVAHLAVGIYLAVLAGITPGMTFTSVDHWALGSGDRY